MTREEAERILEEVTKELNSSPELVFSGNSNYMKDFFRMWRLAWIRESYEIYLKEGIDPDSCIHPGCIKDGKGTKFK